MIDPDGDVVVAGTRDTSDVAVVRFQSNGAIDSTFGSSGVVNTDLGESERGHAVALDSNDNIAVVGTSLAIPGGSDIFVLRYQPDGTLDPSFGSGGVVEFDSGPSENVQDVVVDSHDRILMAAEVAGDTGTNLAVLRYDSGGTLDPDFWRRRDRERRHRRERERGFFGDRCRGKDHPGGGYKPVPQSDRRGARPLHAGWSLNSSFGSNGFATTKVGEGQNVGNGLAFDDAGRILMTGMHREAIGEGDLIVVRFEGSLPPTTTTTATSTTTTTTPVDDAFVDDDGSVFEGDIDAVAAAGITRGCNPPANDRYCPDDLVTRGQMAAFLNRAFLD